ncbi:MAG: hypothetical protein H5U07_01590 [Candidatus Aminicenantes bacterium]|nr:hypothetical protein [Candidatus Aminicenantes bacterium]
MANFEVFRGNCPKSVSKDAKYSVRLVDGKPKVTIVYETEDGERWYPSTDVHPKLVEMVNNVKISVSGKPFGAFYINEFHQVIVPAAGTTDYYLAGEYSEPIRFEFEGKIISGEPKDFDGRPLEPGDIWVGPRAGIPYILEAGGDDIRYEYSPRPFVEKRVRLSSVISKERAARVAHMIRGVKGFAGGRFYVNEFRAIFAPVNKADGLKYIYIGQLDLNDWFPKQ